MNKPIIQTDLNERERSKFASQCRDISRAATELAEALESGDDTKMLISFMLFSLITSSLKELQTIVLASVDKAKLEVKPSDGFLTPEESAAQL